MLLTLTPSLHNVKYRIDQTRNQHLGGIIALLLRDHRTMSIKSVCSSHHMVTDHHWATGAQIKEWQPEQNGLQFLAKDGKRRRVPSLLR